MLINQQLPPIHIAIVQDHFPSRGREKNSQEQTLGNLKRSNTKDELLFYTQNVHQVNEFCNAKNNCLPYSSKVSSDKFFKIMHSVTEGTFENKTTDAYGRNFLKSKESIAPDFVLFRGAALSKVAVDEMLKKKHTSNYMNCKYRPLTSFTSFENEAINCYSYNNAGNPNNTESCIFVIPPNAKKSMPRFTTTSQGSNELLVSSQDLRSLPITKSWQTFNGERKITYIQVG